MITLAGMFFSVIFLLMIPIILGYLWCDICDVPKSFAAMYVFGTFFIWSYSQIILVPMILGNVLFTIASTTLLSVTIIFVLISFYKFYVNNNPVKGRWSLENFSPANVCMKDRIAFSLLLIVVCIIIFNSIYLQHTDADDSRFVVLTMDTIRRGRMLRANPATGRDLTVDIGEVSKDFSSPWAVYMAYIANICGVKGSILIHTIVPFFLYILVTCAYWLLAEVLFPGQFAWKCLFVSLVWYICIFSNYSIMNSETFIMLRIWQGKAIVTGVSIPMFLYGLIKVFREDTWKNWLNLWLINLGSCLLSGNGIVIGVLMLSSYGLVYSVILKRFKYLFFSLMLCSANFVFYMVNQNAYKFLH